MVVALVEVGLGEEVQEGAWVVGIGRGQIKETVLWWLTEVCGWWGEEEPVEFGAWEQGETAVVAWAKLGCQCEWSRHWRCSRCQRVRHRPPREQTGCCCVWSVDG